MKTNGEVAAILGVSPSMASRMRSGMRVGSNTVLIRLSNHTQVDLEGVIHAAQEANQGRKDEWCRIVEEVYADDARDTEPVTSAAAG